MLCMLTDTGTRAFLRSGRSGRCSHAMARNHASLSFLCLCLRSARPRRSRPLKQSCARSSAASAQRTSVLGLRKLRLHFGSFQGLRAWVGETPSAATAQAEQRNRQRRPCLPSRALTSQAAMGPPYRCVGQCQREWVHPEPEEGLSEKARGAPGQLCSSDASRPRFVQLRAATRSTTPHA